MKQSLIDLRDAICYGYATKHDLSSAKREDVVAIKSDPELTQYRFVASEDVAKAADVEERSVTWRASDETADSYGDIVRVKGWDLDRYAKNGQILFGHDREGLPLASGKAWKRNPGKGDGALMVKGNWFEEGVNEFADGVLRIIKAGGLPGTSVGFRAGEVNDPSDPKERSKIGLGDWGLEFTDGHELLENSVVTIPANPNALQERCIKALDGELERWLRTGEKSAAFVREFRKSVTLTAEDLRERLRDAKRKSIVVPEMPGGEASASDDPKVLMRSNGSLLGVKFPLEGGGSLDFMRTDEGVWGLAAHGPCKWMALDDEPDAAEFPSWAIALKDAINDSRTITYTKGVSSDLLDELRSDKARLARTVDHLLGRTSSLEKDNESLRAQCAELQETVTELQASVAGQSQQPAETQRGDGAVESSDEQETESAEEQFRKAAAAYFDTLKEKA